MSRRMSKTLVIDATVARSAGLTDHPVSSACRHVLTTVLQVCHKVAICNRIEKEWRKHSSGYSAKWLAAMQSRGKVVRLNAPGNDLSGKLYRLDFEKKDVMAMLKDAHLVEAALQTDFRIISGDEKAVKLFRAASRHVDELKAISWNDPVDDDCVKWLKAGAKKRN